MRKNAGFTLIELLVVISIIGLLATVVIVTAQSARQRARIAKAQGEVNQLHKAIASLEADTGQLPGHLTFNSIGSGNSGNEVWDLTTPLAGFMQTDGNYPSWSGPYMQALPPDPWGNNYFFDPDYDIDEGAGQRWAAVVGSFGPNGQGQHVYDADNIISVVGLP